MLCIRRPEGVDPAVDRMLHVNALRSSTYTLVSAIVSIKKINQGMGYSSRSSHFCHNSLLLRTSRSCRLLPPSHADIGLKASTRSHSAESTGSSMYQTCTGHFLADHQLTNTSHHSILIDPSLQLTTRIEVFITAE